MTYAKVKCRRPWLDGKKQKVRRIAMTRVTEPFAAAAFGTLVCGVLVFGAHWFTPWLAGGGRTNLFGAGIAIVAVAMASLIARPGVRTNPWPALNVVLGAWLVFSAGWFPLQPDVALAQIVLGSATALLAAVAVAAQWRR
jgi:hypothetical protein